jgi:UDP-N-acetylglucosamine 2-epimerase (non-hydrolysing)
MVETDMKVMTIFGTRPEIIRLSMVMKVLDRHCEHITVHTGQNFHEGLSDIFFRDLNVRTPDIHLGVRSSMFGEQVGQILAKIDNILAEHAPDKVLILGDTNSALSAIVATRHGIPVYHMEAGNRCYDDRVPEETNRRIIDHSSRVLMPYTERSKENLVAEGIDRERIFVTGNPIKQVLDRFSDSINASPILEKLSVESDKYFLATVHRAENVDLPDRLAQIFGGFAAVAERFQLPFLISVHPRTADRLIQHGLEASDDWIRLLDPLGFFDFVKLEKNARVVLTDSGTVQEECCLFRVPNVTVRDVTERPETLEAGSNIISGAEPASILRCVEIAASETSEWSPPPEYLSATVAETVARIVLGYSSFRVHT